MIRPLVVALLLVAAPAHAATFAVLEEHMVQPGGCTPNADGNFGVLGVVYTAPSPVTVTGMYCDLRTYGPGTVEAAWVVMPANLRTVTKPPTPTAGMNAVMCVSQQAGDVVWQQNASVFHLDAGDTIFVFWMHCGTTDAFVNLGAWVTTP